ncbi:hypothetical protein KCP69_18680 [Salmonella enterica subsp. enterica]|nr:hypothetical protein KCP69_18680 [Salmonella enterica subsp. enterica]
MRRRNDYASTGQIGSQRDRGGGFKGSDLRPFAEITAAHAVSPAMRGSSLLQLQGKTLKSVANNCGGFVWHRRKSRAIRAVAPYKDQHCFAWGSSEDLLLLNTWKSRATAGERRRYRR